MESERNKKAPISEPLDTSLEAFKVWMTVQMKRFIKAGNELTLTEAEWIESWKEYWREHSRRR